MLCPDLLSTRSKRAPQKGRVGDGQSHLQEGWLLHIFKASIWIMKPFSSHHLTIFINISSTKCLSKSLKQPKMALTRQSVLGLPKLPSTQLHFSRHLEESSCYQPQTFFPQQVTIHSTAHNGDGKHWCFLSGYIQSYDTALCSKTDSVSALCVSDT